jgi:hypothetical protein
MVTYTIATIPNGCTITNNGNGKFTLVSPVPPDGISSSAIVYFQNTSGSTLSLNVTWSVSGDDNLFYDRMFWYSDITQPSAYISGTPTIGQYQLNSALGVGDISTSDIAGRPISTIGWNNFNGMIYYNPPTQNDSQSISVLSNNWVAVMIAADSDGPLNTFVIEGFSDAGGICFKGDTKIAMIDGENKFIKDIIRGDKVITDKKGEKYNIVTRVVKVCMNCELVKIPKGLIGNTEDIITTKNHPIWVNNDENRVLSKDICGIEILKGVEQELYNIQFEDDGTYYAEGVKVDSLSPNHKKFKLPKVLYWDTTKYDEKVIIKSESDEKYEKPKMITKYNPKNESY